MGEGYGLLRRLSREKDLGKTEAAREEARKAVGGLAAGLGLAELPQEAWEGENGERTRAMLRMCAGFAPERLREEMLRDLARRALERDAAEMLEETGRMGRKWSEGAPPGEEGRGGWRDDSWQMMTEALRRRGWIDECMTLRAWRSLERLEAIGALGEEIREINEIWEAVGKRREKDSFARDLRELFEEEGEAGALAIRMAQMLEEGESEADRKRSKAELAKSHPLIKAVQEDMGYPKGLADRLLKMGLEAPKGEGFRLELAWACAGGSRSAAALARREGVRLGEFGAEIGMDLLAAVVAGEGPGFHEDAGERKIRKARDQRALGWLFSQPEEIARIEAEAGSAGMRLLRAALDAASEAAQMSSLGESAWRGMRDWVAASGQLLGEEAVRGAGKIARPARADLEEARDRMQGMLLGMEGELRDGGMEKLRGSLKEALRIADAALGDAKPKAKARRV